MCEKPRRAFRLPEEDEEYLNSLGLPWETLHGIVGRENVRWLLIHNYSVPFGYNHGQVTKAIKIEPGYPPGKLDMVYFFPALSRNDGKPIIRSQSTVTIDENTFQRWSRHYTWREESDSLLTHLLRVKEWLTNELKRS
jgi:hypothetical protein